LLHRHEWDKWDQFVFQQRDGTLFHTSVWLQHQEHCQLRIYGVFLDGELVAGLPLCVKKKAGFRIVAMPVLTPYSGPVISDNLYKYNDTLELWELFKSVLIEYDAWRMRCFHRSSQLSGLWKKNEHYELKRTNCLFKKTEDELWDGYASSLKRNIRKAKKNGISVVATEDFSTIYHLSAQSFAHSSRKHPMTEDAFLSLASDLCKFGLAKAMVAKDKNGRQLAACWMPVDRQFGYNVIHGIDREYSNLQAGPLVLHETVQACFKSGLNVDFEGSSHDRINKMYQKFGASEAGLTESSNVNNRMLALIVKLKLKKV